MNNMASNMFTEVHSLLRQKRNQRKAEGITHFFIQPSGCEFLQLKKICSSFLQPVLFVQPSSDEFTHPFYD